jgi:hypothetical protein
MTHPGMHIRFATLDMIMQVIAEQLHVRDRGLGHGRVGEMAWEEDKGDVADVFARAQAAHVADLQWWVPVRVEDLGCGLDRGLAACVNEFL